MAVVERLHCILLMMLRLAQCPPAWEIHVHLAAADYAFGDDWGLGGGGGGGGGGGRVPQLEFNFASSRDFSCFKPVALRKAKIVYSYGLYKCNRVKLLFFA